MDIRRRGGGLGASDLPETEQREETFDGWGGESKLEGRLRRN